MFPISCTTEFINTPTTTIDTVGTADLYFFGNHELMPKIEIHLIASDEMFSIGRRSTLPLSFSSSE
jgi:hypothetical protein